LPCTGWVCSMRQRVSCLTKPNPRGHVSIKHSCKPGCATCSLYSVRVGNLIISGKWSFHV
jgi:hypothetical protein